MDSLNDDCIYEICKRLELQEQINMALIHCDFRNELLPLWQRSYAELDLREIEKITNSEFFIQSIQETVKKLILNFKANDIKRMFSVMKFTNLETIHSNHVIDKENVFEDLVLLIGESCPNLTELRLAGEISGKNIDKLKKLERIDFTCNPGALNNVYAREFFHSVKLKKVALSKCVHFEDWECTGIASDELVNCVLLCETLEELYFDTEFMQKRFLDLMLVRLKQLRKLAFSGFSGLDYTRIKGNICGAVQGLVIKGCSYSSIYGLLSLLARLNNLELLSLSNIRIDLNFLRQIIEIGVSRRQPLSIFCYKTQLNETDLRLLTLPDWITVSLNAYENNAFSYYDIQLLLKN